MALVDPYSPCPCGSGQKFKWCCQKVEAFAERAERLYEGGQIDAALGTLDEGLRKVPDNPWLLVRKALINMHYNGLVARAEEAVSQGQSIGSIMAGLTTIASITASRRSASGRSKRLPIFGRALARLKKMTLWSALESSRSAAQAVFV